jgi:hypothetical protein
MVQKRLFRHKLLFRSAPFDKNVLLDTFKFTAHPKSRRESFFPYFSNRVASPTGFESILASNRFRIVDEGAKDGDCLFEAITDQYLTHNNIWSKYTDDPSDPAERSKVLSRGAKAFRLRIVQHIYEYWPRYFAYLSDPELRWDQKPDTVHDFVSTMKRPKIYGDATCILALANLMQRPVIVYYVEGNELKSIEFQHDPEIPMPSFMKMNADRILLGWRRGSSEDGNHYVSLYPSNHEI